MVTPPHTLFQQLVFSLSLLLLLLLLQCMRENVKFQVEAAQDRAEEASLRCCLGPPVSVPQCGMLPQDV